MARKLVTVTARDGVKAFFSVREIAVLLGLSGTYVRDLIRAGRIPSLHMGRRILVPASWVAALQAGVLPGKTEG